MDTNDQTPATKAQRAATDVLADAIRVLTEAARLRHPVMEHDADGQWREHPTDTRQPDWAAFVTQALAGAAANIGSVDAALAGRPGSWEADKVGDLLRSTVGHDEKYLFEHRTEPLRVVVDVEQILADLDMAWLYDDAEAALDQMEGDATAGIDYSPYEWTYTPDDNGQFVATDPQAPPWSIEAWRADQAGRGADDNMLAYAEQTIVNGPVARVSIVKSPEAERAVEQLAEQEDAIHDDFRARFEALAAQREREWTTYAAAFAANIRREAARRYPGIPVHIDLRTIGPSTTADADWDCYDSPETHLIEFATRHTPLPGSGIAPKDYPAGTSILAAETAAGRLPHLRLPTGPQVTETTDDAHERG
ncbi:MAG: hypothetical protein ACRDQB_06120 [Thermocrispum sp.]